MSESPSWEEIRWILDKEEATGEMTPEEENLCDRYFSHERSRVREANRLHPFNAVKRMQWLKKVSGKPLADKPEQRAKAIISDLRTSDLSTAEIANKYGVSDHLVQDISTGKKWKKLTGGKRIKRPQSAVDRRMKLMVEGARMGRERLKKMKEAGIR